jgi:polysaccharide biosynthesis/export protein
LKIYFPGAANLNTTQRIRMDGKIDMPLIGEIKVSGMTPTELREELLKRYADQLVSKEIMVTVEASSFTIYVTGAVLRPGPIHTDHPLTALEAIMEAGGFDYAKANLKAVVVIRHEEGKVKTFILNLKLPLQGKPSEPFYLKPSDIIRVQERFALF